MPQTDIIIKLSGSAAKTITARATALDRLAMSVGRVKTAFAGAPFQKATSGMKGFNSEIRKATTGAKQYGKAADKAGQRTDRFGTKIKGAGNALDNFGTLFRRMVRIMTAFFVITAVTRVVREFTTTLISAPMRMELWNVQLTVLSKNATLAAQRLELLKRVAVETPLELPDLFEGLTTLQAFSVEISERTIPLITDLAAVSGRTFREAAEIVGKVIAGSPTAITRSLPTVAINPNEFKALAAELGSRSEALFQIIEGKFEGFAKESATTVLGVLSNIKDAWFNIMAEIGEGAMMPMRDAFQDIMDYLGDLYQSPKRLEAMKVQIRLIVDELVQFIRSIVEATRKVNEFVGYLGGFRMVLNTILLLLTMKGVVMFARVVAGWIKPLKGATTAMTLLNIQMGLWLFAANAAIVLLGGALLTKYTKWKDSIRQARLEQLELNDELGRMNRALERNIDLVDAATVARQGARIKGVGVGFAFETAGATAAEVAYGRTDLGRQLGSQLDEARAIANEFGSGALTSIVDAATIAMGQAALHVGTEKAFADAFAKIKPAFLAQGDEFIELAKELRERAARVIETASGDPGGDEDGEDPLAEFFKFWKDNFKPFKDEFEVLQSKFKAGLITRADAREQASVMQELMEKIRLGFLLDESPFMQQVGVTLSPIISNMDSFIGGIDSEITDAFKQKLIDIKLQMELGMDDEVAVLALTALKEQLMKQMEILEDTMTPEMRAAFEGIFRGINGALESLKPEDMSQALEQVMRMVIKQGADAISDALASIISPELGVSLGQAMGQLFSSMLNVMGDAMIQMGIGAKIIQDLFKDITNPASAFALIAGGIALKTFAKAIGGRMKSAAQGGGGGGAGAMGALNYPQFSPGAYGDKRSWYVEINALDAASFEQVIARNPAAFGRQIAVIAREDKATGGQAYGAFQPG